MLVEIKNLEIKNTGYSRLITHGKMYINANNVVSIVDYDGANNFLVSENSSYSDEKFSLIKLNEGGTMREIIAFGTAEDVYESFNNSKSKRLLNG